MDYDGLKGYFASLRAAFDDLTISRGVMVVGKLESMEPGTDGDEQTDTR